MRMMNELKPLFLYPAKSKVHAPIDEKDKRHNSAILLLSPNIEVSSKLMNLPYIHNPNLFTSFYVDQNVSAYIGKIKDMEFDEKEEEAVSEAMLRNYNSRVKIKFDDEVSMIDKSIISSVINPTGAKAIYALFKLSYMPQTIKVFVHPNLSSLRESAPSDITALYQDRLYSYSNENEIHVVRKNVYDPEIMGGAYEIYLKNELICSLLKQCNPDLHPGIVLSIAQNFSGLQEWKKNNKDSETGLGVYNNLAKSLSNVVDINGIDPIIKYIKTNNISALSKITGASAIRKVRKSLFESEISYFDRQRLLPSDFGVPNKRKYPLHDEEHVKIAIKQFNNCDPSEEKELGESIVKKIDSYGITDVKVSASNRFKPYYDEYLRKKKEKEKKEAQKNNKPASEPQKINISDGIKKAKEKIGKFFESSFENSDYGDILTICNHLSPEELKRVTFYDTYRDSQFVIKRIIKRVGGEPAGFLDVYLFPSKPEIAQIVIAVSNKFRGQGISDEMVKELLNSDLHQNHNFDMYYWTAHADNIASQNLAMKNGFTDTDTRDKYNRMVFIKPVVKENLLNESSLEYISESVAIINEADNSEYTQRLKKYLYNERIKNNKQAFELYERVKQMNPIIKRTYIKLDMYKGLNIFVDLSYYNGLFLKNNTYKLDKAVQMYFDFINRLINNKEVDKAYKKKTIFIPIDKGVWPIVPDSDIFDYKKNLNPISVIFRLIRTDLNALRKAWGNKDIIFVGSRGYFKIDFKTLEVSNLNRIRINLEKLMSEDIPIKDDFEVDDTTTNDTPKAMAAKMIDKVETGTSIKLDNISGSPNSSTLIKPTHLQISKGELDMGEDKSSIVIVSIDPEGPDGYEKLSKTILSDVGKVSIYCMPK